MIKTHYLFQKYYICTFSIGFKKKIILELHHEITGFSKFIYFILKYLGLIQNLKYVFLHKQLKYLYKINKKRNIVLDDASNVEDFNKKGKEKEKIHACTLEVFLKEKELSKYLDWQYKIKIFPFIFMVKKILKISKKN